MNFMASMEMYILMYVCIYIAHPNASMEFQGLKMVALLAYTCNYCAPRVPHKLIPLMAHFRKFMLG